MQLYFYVRSVCTVGFVYVRIVWQTTFKTSLPGMDGVGDGMPVWRGDLHGPCTANGDMCLDGGDLHGLCTVKDEVDGVGETALSISESSAVSLSSSDGQQHASVSISSGLNKRRRLGNRETERVECLLQQSKTFAHEVVRERSALTAAGVNAFRMSGEAVVADLTPGEDGVLRCAVARRRLADSLGVPSRRLRLFPVGSVDELGSDDDVINDLQLCVLQPLRVATASRLDRSVRIWNADTGFLEYVFYPPLLSRDILCMNLSPNGKCLVTASGDSATVWNLETRSVDLVIEAHDTNVYFAILSPDGMRLATVHHGGVLKIWNSVSGFCEASFSMLGFVISRSLSPDGSRIVAAPYDTLRHAVWNTGTGACELMLPEGVPRGLHSVCFSRDGRRLAIINGFKFSAGIWCLDTCVLLLTLNGHVGLIHCISFSSDGMRVATASADNTAKIWSVDTGACECTLRGHDDGVFCVRFSADGRRLVTSSYDRTAKIWNTRAGVCELTLFGHGDIVHDAAFIES